MPWRPRGSHVPCVFVSQPKEEGPGQEEGQVALGVTEPQGFSEPGQQQEGNSSLRLPVSAATGFLPFCPLPARGRRASPYYMQIVGKFTSVSF